MPGISGAGASDTAKLECPWLDTNVYWLRTSAKKREPVKIDPSDPGIFHTHSNIAKTTTYSLKTSVEWKETGTGKPHWHGH